MSSCGSWLSSLHTKKFNLEPMLSLTTLLAETAGRVQKMSNASPTFELLSKRYVRKSRQCLASLKVVYLFRSNVPMHHFGYRHRTIQLKTLYITECTSQRIRRSFLTVTKSITTRRGIRIRAHQLISVKPRSMLTRSSLRQVFLQAGAFPRRHIDMC